MDEILTYGYTSGCCAADIYAVLSEPGNLPLLFNHIKSVEPAGDDETNYTEHTKSVFGKRQQIRLQVSRKPGESVGMQSDHRILKMGMEINLTEVSEGQCLIEWKVLTRRFPFPANKLLVTVFKWWYLPKIKQAIINAEGLIRKHTLL
ncbi:MAG TPA: hypothetical protein VG603_09950 [Chitinophagales bacterium]|nr:hypothetical protein [Chitinophagales bacterium]